MTTIVYKERVIAYDSRSTRGSLIENDNFSKCWKRDGVLFFLSGIPAEAETLMDAYFKGIEQEVLESHALVVDQGKLYHFGKTKDEGQWKHEIDLSEIYAIGSGEDHAYTAMDCGCSAVEAVKMAKKRDTGTGGRIRKYKL